MPALIAPLPRQTGLHLQIGRALKVPRELVFRAFTEIEHARHWWAPRHFTVADCEIDLRPGGTWRSRMDSPDWGTCWIGGVYLEITRPERLSFTFALEDLTEGPVSESLETVRFAELKGMTVLSLHQGPVDDPDTRNGYEDAWTSALEVLSEYLVARTRACLREAHAGYLSGCVRFSANNGDLGAIRTAGCTGSYGT